MSVELANISVALPEMFTLVMACVALLLELFCGHKVKNIAYLWVQVTLIVLVPLSLAQVGEFRSVSFHGLYIADDIANLLKTFIYLSSFAAFYYSRQYNEERKIPAGEFYILGLFSILGMMVLVSAGSLLSVYLGLELLSLPLYAMVALSRDDANASEASMKYFVMGAIASAMLLYGMSMLYGATGSLDISVISKAIATNWPDQALLLSFALVFILVALCFKLAAVPFHMWAPDVYTGAPSSVTIFLSSAPKLAAIGMTIRLLVFALPELMHQWQQILILVALLSTGLGNLFAIVQTNIKRMLAYSAIAHSGYAFFGILAGTNAGFSSALFYILVYGLMSVAAFGLIVLLSRNGLEAENIEDFKGLNSRNPWLAFLMLIVMFSMAGVPPTVGFFTKLLVLQALVDAHLTWLAVFGLLFAVIGAFYYIRIVKMMYFDSPVEDTKISLSKDLNLVYSINALSLLILGIFPGALMQACLNAFTS